MKRGMDLVKSNDKNSITRKLELAKQMSLINGLKWNFKSFDLGRICEDFDEHIVYNFRIIESRVKICILTK